MSALARFERALTQHEERAVRHQMAAGVVGLVCVLALVAWAVTL